MGTATTRRAVLGGLSAVASLTGIGSVPAHAMSTVSPRLARLIAAHDRAYAAYEHHSEHVDEPATEAYYAALKSYQPEAEPAHRSVSTTFENFEGQTIRLSTERWAIAATARRVRDDPSWADMGAEQPEWRQANIELADLADERATIIAQQKAREQAHDDACRARLGLDAIERRSEALSDREHALWEAVVDEPANSLADLVAKLDMNDRSGRIENDAFVAALAADIRRIAGATS